MPNVQSLAAHRGRKEGRKEGTTILDIGGTEAVRKTSGREGWKTSQGKEGGMERMKKASDWRTGRTREREGRIEQRKDTTNRECCKLL